MQTDKHIFFWAGIFSNFHPINSDSSFTSEKIFMAAKAACFRDHRSFEEINNSVTPRAAKTIGRRIIDFDEDIWDIVKIDAMNFALDIKFKACPEFRDALRASGDLILVEASPHDNVWGIGFTADEALINEHNWGKNLLGKCLMGLRHKYFGT